MQRGLVSGPPDPNEVDSYIAIHRRQHGDAVRGLRRARPRRAHRAAANRGRGTGSRLRAGQDRDSGHVRVDRTASRPRAGPPRSAAPRREPQPPRRAACCSSWRRSGSTLPLHDLTITKGVVSVARRRAALGHVCRPRRRQIIQPNVRAVRLQRRHRAAAQERRPRDPEAARRLPHRGTRVPRPDIAEKIRGTYQYVQHVRAARDAARPRRLAARARRARHQQSDGRPASTSRRSRTSPGVQIVRRSNFVGVVAEREWDAVRAAQAVEGHVGTVRGGPPGPRGLVRQLQIGQDQRPDRHRHRRRRRRARARVPTSSRPRIAGRTNRTGRWRRTALSPTSRATARS